MSLAISLLMLSSRNKSWDQYACRSLKITHTSERMCQIAPSGLQSISCGLKPIVQNNWVLMAFVLRDIGSLRALTRLELRGLRPADTQSVPQIRALPLQELVLLGCNNLELQLIVPGRLTSLRRLHIEEPRYCQKRAIEQRHVKDNLTACARNLLSLPQLSQLSGSSALFRIARRADIITDWPMSAYEPNLMTSNSLPDFGDGRIMTVWKRPWRVCILYCPW